MTKDFEELFECLNKNEVEYLVVGAHAVAYHAKPRFTKDMDILVRPSIENARRLLRALADFGFGQVGLTEDDFSAPGLIIQLGIAPNRIDLITAIGGVTFDKAWDSRVYGRYGKQEVSFIGKQELIASKEAAGRPQDLSDLSWLKKSKS